MRYHWFVPCTAALCVFLAPLRSGADPPKATNVQDNRQLALDHAHRGLDAYKEGRFEKAYAHFRLAQQLFPAPTLLVHLARCQRKLGKFVEAKKLYQEIVAKPLRKDAPPPFVEAHRNAEREIAEVDAEIAAKKEADDIAKPSRGFIVPGTVTLGFGVVGFGVGALTSALSQSQMNDILTRCQETRCLASDRAAAEDARMLGRIATAAFVVGGAAVAAGAFLLVLRPGNNTDATRTATKDLRIQVGLGRIDVQVRY